MGGLSGDRCRRCAHYECCGGPQYGCYPSFPEGDGECDRADDEDDEDDDCISPEPERDREKRKAQKMKSENGMDDVNEIEPFWVVTWVEEIDCNETSGILNNAVYGTKAQAEIEMMKSVQEDYHTCADNGYGTPSHRRFNDGKHDGVCVTGDMFTCDYRLVPVTFR